MMKKISFYSKNDNGIKGHILFYNNSLQIKQYDIQINNLEKVFLQLLKGINLIRLISI